MRLVPSNCVDQSLETTGLASPEQLCSAGILTGSSAHEWPDDLTSLHVVVDHLLAYEARMNQLYRNARLSA